MAQKINIPGITERFGDSLLFKELLTHYIYSVGSNCWDHLFHGATSSHRYAGFFTQLHLAVSQKYWTDHPWLQELKKDIVLFPVGLRSSGGCLLPSSIYIHTLFYPTGGRVFHSSLSRVLLVENLTGVGATGVSQLTCCTHRESRWKSRLVTWSCRRSTGIHAERTSGSG